MPGITTMKTSSSKMKKNYNENETWYRLCELQGRTMESDSIIFLGNSFTATGSPPIESYNDFVQVQIPKTIAMFNPYTCVPNKTVPEVNKYRLEMFITFENFEFIVHKSTKIMAQPLMFPRSTAT